MPRLAHQSAYVVLEPLRIGLLERLKTKRISKPGCWALISSCFLRSSTSKMPFVSTIIPFLRIRRSEEHTSELQSLMRISYAVFCLKKKNTHRSTPHTTSQEHELIT